MTLFPHCPNKLKGQLPMGIQKNSYRAFSMRSKVRTYSIKFPNHTKKTKRRWYDFSNVKSSKMLSFDSIAEAQGLIYPSPSGENFRFAYTPCLMMGEVSLGTSPIQAERAACPLASVIQKVSKIRRLCGKWSNAVQWEPKRVSGSKMNLLVIIETYSLLS